MIHNFKVACLALVGVLATLVAGASSASASNAQFHSEAAHTTMSGTQVGTMTFTTNAGSPHCKVVKFASTTTASTTSQLTTSLDYTECNFTAFGGESLSATVDTSGCDYVFTANGSLDFSCESGKLLRTTAPFCTVTVTTPQTASKTSYVNTGSGTTREIDVKFEVTGLKYTQTAFCPTGGGTFENGSISGTASLTGENTEGKHVGLWWSTGQ